MAGFTTNKTHKAVFAATRRRFLVLGTASAALCLFPVLAGCSGGSKKDAPDSDYVGSYRAAYTIPGVAENGTFSFSVAQKGDMIGSFVDSSSNASRAFAGHVDNNGTFSGTTTDTNGATTFATSGTVSKVVSSSTGGDFRQNRNGTTVSGSFSYLISGIAPATDSPYAGAFSGSYNLSGQVAGPASYSIDKQGNVTGFVTTNGVTGTLHGQVNATGALTGTIAYSANDTATLTGAIATSTTNGQTAGNFVEARGGVSRPGTFGAPIALASNTPFLGAFRGTYGIADINDSGDVSFTVDPSGKIAGSFNQNNNGVAGVFAGAIASDGNFNGTLTYPATGSAAAFTRSIQGKMVKGGAAASDKLQADFVVQDTNGVIHPGSLDTLLNAASNEDNIYRGGYANNYQNPVAPTLANPNANPPILANPGKVAFYPFVLFGTVGSPVPEKAGITLTIDKQGKVIGTVYGTDGSALTLTGSVTNDGRFTALLSNDANSYQIVGKLSKQVVSTVNQTTPSQLSQLAGIAADFQVTINGKDYTGTFAAPGGFTSN